MHFYDFKSGLKTAESDCSMNSALGENTVFECLRHDCFARFRIEDHDVRDRPHSGHPSSINDEGMRQGVEHHPQQTTRELAEALGLSQSSVAEHWWALGFMFQAVKVGTAPADGDVAPTRYQSNCFVAVVQAYHDLPQVHCTQRAKVGSVRLYLA